MESFLKADIFFFVTTVAVIAVSVGLIVVAIYAVKILKDINYISGKVKEESDEIIKDVKIFREEAKKEGSKLRGFLDFLFVFLKPKKKTIKKGRSKKKKDESK